MLRFWDYFFVLRPVLWLPVWTVSLLGARSALRHQAGTTLGTRSNLLLILTGALLFGAVYLLNQIFDIESDRVNRKLRFLPEKLISVTAAVRETVLLNMAALIVAFSVSIQTGWLAASIVILGILYSAPPFRLKNHPLGGLLANMLAHGSIVFWLGWSFIGKLSGTAVLQSLPYFLSVGGIYLNTTVPDIPGDARAGKRTLAVIWGPKWTRLLAVLLVTTAALAAYRVHEVPLLVAALASLPPFLLALLQNSTRLTILSTKLALVVLSAFACYYSPPYLLILIVGFLATRLYYRRRFGLVYPSLGT